MLDWFRIGAWFSDRGMEGLRDAISAGASERELADAVERGYVGLGGTTGIHFIGTTPMRNPAGGGAVAVSFVAAGGRRATSCFPEITATFWDHSGQVLRSFTVGEEPTPLYRDLHARRGRGVRRDRQAWSRPGATPAQVIEASGLIRRRVSRSSTTSCTATAAATFRRFLGIKMPAPVAVPEEPFEAGMMVVVQPNADRTCDGRAGVQAGNVC